MPILKTISPKVPGSLEDIAAPHKIWKKNQEYACRNIPVRLPLI